MIWRFARYACAAAALHAGAIFYGLGNLVEMPHMRINEHAYVQFGGTARKARTMDSLVDAFCDAVEGDR
jgi:hypothetical protein